MTKLFPLIREVFLAIALGGMGDEAGKMGGKRGNCVGLECGGLYLFFAGKSFTILGGKHFYLWSYWRIKGGSSKEGWRATLAR